METRRSTQGSALIIVLWAIVIMSACVLGLIGYLYSNMDETTALKKESRASQLAQSGIAIGLNPQVGRADPLLKQTLAPGEGFEVRLRSEGGRLNINTVLQNKEWTVLQELFSEWGVQESDIGNLITGYQNWAYPGATAGRTGTAQPAVAPAQTGTTQPVIVAGQTGTAQFQAARLFDSVDEMLTVPGMDALAAAKPDWRDYFTIWSDGPLDMNDAPADLIAAVCGVGMQRAQQFVSTRLGPDGLPDTEDDVIFTSLDQVRVILGMSTQEFAAIQSLLSVQDSTTRIESSGTLGAYRRKITTVVRRNVSPPIFLLWQE